MTRRKTTDYIVVHSTNTKPNVDLSARDIDERHRKRGLLKIGYHCVIKRDGTIELGRPFNEIGAHLQDYDIKSVGICIIGGLNTRGVVAPDYTSQQQKSLYVLIKTLTYMYKDAKVIGHNNLEKTDCPSFDVQEWWESNYQINFKIGGL
jgi:N-acetyl-anhydromuramyl-L-alanine amidase AmpD|tara:strand:+ start:392 stop:838 length:447 start_codon:yes stop_codon:yes gene_type:complete